MRALLPFMLVACSVAPAQNVLLVIMDDTGSEFLEFHPMGYDAQMLGGELANTPTLSALAEAGISYTNAWANPNCSPTRAALLTGNFPHRTGVTSVVSEFLPSSAGLGLGETTFAERLSARGYPTALFGKWHLMNDPESACEQGFSHFDGALGNVGWGGGSYYSWTRWTDTPTSAATALLETTYNTQATTDAALAWVQAQSGPWFCMVSYNAAHKPLHNPPGSLALTQDAMYRDMIEYMDGELGRLLSGIDMGSATVIVVGDNGSPGSVAMPPNTPATTKGEAYRGSIEVPLVVSGQAVTRAINAGKNTAGQELDGQVNVVDIYKTLLRLMPGNDGQSWPAVDSKALYRKGAWVDDKRAWNFCERSKPLNGPPGGPYTLLRRGYELDGYKSVWREDGSVELYDTLTDPWETVDLLADGVSVTEQGVLDLHTANLGSLGL